MARLTKEQIEVIGEAMVVIALLLDDEATADERARAVKTGEAFLAKHRYAIAREYIREFMFEPAKNKIDLNQNAQERQ